MLILIPEAAVASELIWASDIDGNFGCKAGLAELLVQSYGGAIDILPVLPGAWPAGEVKGLVARGGYVVDVAWDKGKVPRLRISSRPGSNWWHETNGRCERESQPILPALTHKGAAGIGQSHARQAAG